MPAAQLRVCSDLQVYEGAVPYFSLAARVQPHEVKWQLMVASCYRRIGNYQQVSMVNLLSASICSLPATANKRLLQSSGHEGHCSPVSGVVPGARYLSEACMQKLLRYLQQQQPSVLQELPLG